MFNSVVFHRQDPEKEAQQGEDVDSTRGSVPEGFHLRSHQRVVSRRFAPLSVLLSCPTLLRPALRLENPPFQLFSSASQLSIPPSNFSVLLLNFSFLFSKPSNVFPSCVPTFFRPAL